MSDNLLSLDALLSNPGRRSEMVQVPELNGKVRVMALSSDQVLGYRKLEESEGDNKDRDIAVYLLLGGIVDDRGAPMFNEQTIQKFMANVSIDALTLLTGKISELTSPKKDADRGNSEANPTA